MLVLGAFGLEPDPIVAEKTDTFDQVRSAADVVDKLPIEEVVFDVVAPSDVLSTSVFDVVALSYALSTPVFDVVALSDMSSSSLFVYHNM